MSHIHVSVAYRSRIYENFDTPRSETYFVQSTYVPRTCDIPETFLWHTSDVPVFVWDFFSYLRRIKAYGLRTCDVCMAYEAYAWRIYGVCTTFHSYLRRICTNCVLYTNACVHFVHAKRTLHLSIIRGRRCHRRNLDNLDKHRIMPRGRGKTPPITPHPGRATT